MPEKPERTIFSISSGSIFKVIAILALCFFLFYIKDVILAVLASVVIASALEPTIRFLLKYKIPRTGAVVIVYICLVVLIGLFFYFVVPVLLNELLALSQTLPDLINSLNLKSTDMSGIEKAIRGVSSSTSFSEYFTSITNVFSSLGKNPFDTARYLFGGVSAAVIIIVLSFYLSAQHDGVGDFLRIVTPLRYESYVIGLWRRSQRNIARWMQGQLMLGLMVGFFVYLGLRILGIRHALILALISAIFEIIPVFGPILGSIPGIVISFVDGGIPLALLVAGLYVIVQQLESNVIYPLVVKKVIGVPPMVVIISLVIGLSLAGVLGVILSVPIATVLMEYLNDRERNRRLPVN